MHEQSKLTKLLISFICVAVGNCMYAVTVTLFLIPANLVTGGSTGLALGLNHFTGLPISTIVLIFNVTMLILGLFILGKAFTVTTLASSFIYPAALEFCTRVFDGVHLTDDIFLNMIFSGIGIGVSIGLVIRSGSSTGGMDIPVLVLNKKFRIPVSVSMYVFDICVLLLQASFRPVQNVLYGIVLIMVYTIVLDKMMMVGTTKTESTVISEKTDEICESILTDLQRGVTLLNGQGGFHRDDKHILLSVLSNREVPKVEKIILSIDPEAFIMINRISEVHGRGFSLKRNPKTK